MRALGRTTRDEHVRAYRYTVELRRILVYVHLAEKFSRAEIRLVLYWIPRGKDDRSGLLIVRNCLEIAMLCGLRVLFTQRSPGHFLTTAGYEWKICGTSIARISIQRDDSNARNVDRSKISAVVYQV